MDMCMHPSVQAHMPVVVCPSGTHSRPWPPATRAGLTASPWGEDRFRDRTPEHGAVRGCCLSLPNLGPPAPRGALAEGVTCLPPADPGCPTGSPYAYAHARARLRLAGLAGRSCSYRGLLSRSHSDSGQKPGSCPENRSEPPTAARRVQGGHSVRQSSRTRPHGRTEPFPDKGHGCPSPGAYCPVPLPAVTQGSRHGTACRG